MLSVVAPTYWGWTFMWELIAIMFQNVSHLVINSTLAVEFLRVGVQNDLVAAGLIYSNLYNVTDFISV